MKKKSLVLFGEGKCDAIFLNHLRSAYRSELAGILIKVDGGNGGSPKHVASRLIKQYLSVGAYSGVLLLIDSDVENDIPQEWIKKHGITLLRSTPCCLEGVLLCLLDDLPRSGRNRSASWKSKFQKDYLKTDRDAVGVRMKQKCPELFPRALLDRKRSDVKTLDDLLNFLGVS